MRDSFIRTVEHADFTSAAKAFEQFKTNVSSHYEVIKRELEVLNKTMDEVLKPSWEYFRGNIIVVDGKPYELLAVDIPTSYVGDLELFFEYKENFEFVITLYLLKLTRARRIRGDRETVECRLYYRKHNTVPYDSSCVKQIQVPLDFKPEFYQSPKKT